MIIDLLKKWCSVRKFKQTTISQDTIEYIIEAGRLSPSGGNEQQSIKVKYQELIWF